MLPERRPGRLYTYVQAALVTVFAVLGLSGSGSYGGAIRAAIPARSAAVPAVVTPAAPREVLPVAGWVIDGDGLPIAGVQIAIRTGDTTSPVIAETETDGAFRMRPLSGHHQLLLDAPHVFPAEVGWQGGPPPRIMLTRRVHVVAHVSSGGAAVAGAEVHLGDGSTTSYEVALTDAAGVARFDDLSPGPYEVWATHGKLVSPLVRAVQTGVDDAEIALALAPAGSVKGRIVTDGVVPAGVTAQLVPVEVDHAVRVAVVDDHGTFAIDGVPRGRWRLEVAAPGYVRADEPLVDVADGVAEVEARLIRAGVVVGTVVDNTGTPVEGATIVLREQGPANATARDEVPVEQHLGPVASTQLRWVHPLAGQRQMPIRDSRRFGALRPGARPAECGHGHCGVDLGITRGVVVHAAADGEVVAVYTEIRERAGRYVAIEHGAGLRSFYMHLQDIRADLEIGQKIRAGDPIGTVGSTGFATNNPHLHFAISQEQNGRTWFVDPEPILRHAVVLPAARSLDPREPVGAGAPTLVAAVRWSELGGATPGAPAAPAGPTTITTDARGGFRIEGVAPGTYVAAAFAAELAPGVSSAFGVKIGEETTGVTVALPLGVIVFGRVLGPGGAVNGARIVADEGVGETMHKVATGFTDVHGEFQLRALAGKVTLQVSATGFGSVERTITLDAGDRMKTRRREDFELAIEDRRLDGMVLGPDGVPAGGVVVRIIDGPTRRRRGVTDPTGRFLIDHMASGDYVVELSSPDFPTTRATIEADRYKELRLEAGGQIRLEVRDAHTGSPIAGLRVDAVGPDGRSARPQVGADGRALVRGLAAGGWKLRARVQGYVAAEASVDVRARETEDVRLELARGATLSGVVRDRYGQRVAGARVWLGGASTRTDQDGQFRLIDVPTGRGTLQAERDAAKGSVPVDLAPGDELTTLSIDLAE